MSSYLFIVKSELPLVIQAFLSKHENTGWVSESRSLHVSHPVTALSSQARVCCLIIFPPPICVSDCLSLREWFLNGNYLIIIVSACIILPLALMRQLGMFSLILLSHFCSVFLTFFTTRHNRSATTPICCCSPVFQVVAVLLAIGKTLWSSYHSLPCRLPGLHQRFLPHLHGVLPHLGEPPKLW